MVVQVLINGTQSAHLIVDTGATMTVLSYEIGVELGLLSGSGVDLSTVNTAGGSVQVSMTKVDHLQVGEAHAEQVQVAIHDLPDGISGVSGLLGMSFLKNFTVTLDSDRGFLYLTPRQSK
jgi:clan AA aspartic protease (TIGR02281 family)